MASGIVKWFNSQKGYGVVQPVDGGFNVFVRVAAVERAGVRELKEGQTIGFEIVTDDRTGELFAEDLVIPAIDSTTLDAGARANSQPAGRLSGLGADWAAAFYSQYGW